MTSKMIQIAAVAIVGLAIGISYSPLHAQAAPSHSVWDGVYTKAQAARGATLYHQSCEKCHGADLTGTGDQAPALVGDSFLSDWTGLTASDLFDRIHKTMPADSPGSLSEAASTDIMAFILSSNKFPAGTKELGHDAGELGQIGIQSTKPAK
jgi:cytochrome c